MHLLKLESLLNSGESKQKPYKGRLYVLSGTMILGNVDVRKDKGRAEKGAFKYQKWLHSIVNLLMRELLAFISLILSRYRANSPPAMIYTHACAAAFVTFIGRAHWTPGQMFRNVKFKSIGGTVAGV